MQGVSVDAVCLYLVLSLASRRIQEFIDLDRLVQPDELRTLREYLDMNLQEYEHAAHP